MYKDVKRQDTKLRPR